MRLICSRWAIIMTCFLHHMRVRVTLERRVITIFPYDSVTIKTVKVIVVHVYNKVQATHAVSTAHGISTEEEDVCCSKLRPGTQDYNGLTIIR